MKSQVYRPAFLSSAIQVGLCTFLVACGNWVGNPKQSPEEEPGGANGSFALASSGDVVLHKVQALAGQPLEISYAIQAGAGLLATEDKAFEVSIIDTNGKELAYTRKSAGRNSVGFTPETDGAYQVLIKNNSGSEVELEVQESKGASADEGVSNITSEGEGVNSKIMLKAIITFSKQCKSYTQGGASTSTTTAPAGSYYIQPFVFLGSVDPESQLVTPLSTATITITSGEISQELKKLADFELNVFREIGALGKDQHVDYTRNFYSGYFGAAGEMYTTSTFRFGGDCSQAPVFALPDDPGTAEILLNVKDSKLSPALSVSYPIRPTVGTSFTMYEKSGQKLDNWDPCSYDAFTALPKNYNDSTKPCRQLSFADAPYVTLDYLLPSEQVGTALSKASDPTRLLYYGYSYARAFKKAIIDKQDELRNGLSEIGLDVCLSNGGMHAVPLSKDKTFLPLREFNTRTGDLIQLSRKTGSYTALTDFYQGNVKLNGKIDYAICIPNNATQTSCDSYKVIKVDVKECQIKADSGITASSISDSFIYPEYYELSGEVVE